MIDSNLEELIMCLGGKCALCHASYVNEGLLKKKKKKKRGNGWLIHHRRYPKGEKSSKDFKTRTPHIITRGKRKGKNIMKIIYDKDAYYAYLLPKVKEKKTPTAYYVPVHNSCHQAITRLAFWSVPNMDRLYALAREQKA